MNPFSRQDWKRSARRAQQGNGGGGWVLAGILLVIAIVLTFLR